MVNSEERQMIVGLFPFLSANPIVIDGGSNKGGFSDVFIDEYKDDVNLYLFEPNKKLLSYTEIKYEYQKNIRFLNLALYKETGEIPFYYFENFNNELSSIYKDDTKWGGLPLVHGKTDCITLDKFCKDNKISHIDYLKLDLEGSDVDALMGCKRLIPEDAITIIQIEYSEHYKRANHSIREVFDIFKNTGYKIYSFDGNYTEVNEFEDDFIPQNFIITKREIRNYSIGWNTEFIYNTAPLGKFDMVLEVGGFEGVNTKYICENLLNEGGRVNVVDPLEDYYIEGDTEHPYFRDQHQRFLRNTRGCTINLYRGKSEVELPKLNALRHDLCYVDGDHRKESVYFDLCWAFAITKVGGYVLADDYEWREDTKEGIDKFLSEFSGTLEVISKGYQVLIQKKINHYNSITQSYYL